METPPPASAEAELEALRRRVRELELEVGAARADVRFLEAVERVDAQMRRARSLEALLEQLLDDLLAVFGCDRAWLLYPCDPEAPSWGVPMERTLPEWPGVFALGVEIPMEPGAAGVFRESLATEGALPFDATTVRQVPEDIRQAFGVQAQMCLAVRPRSDRPWLLGIHHCTESHVFTAEEIRLFESLGRRIADYVDTMILLRDLRATEQQVARLQRMDAIGHLAGGIAHDFNNRLLVMLCYADLIEAGDDASLSAFAEEILRAGRNAAELTQQLLAFSRRSVLQAQPVDLVALSERLAPFLQRILGSTIELEVSLPEDGPAVAEVDPHQLEQLIINLVNNARDALPRGGRVRVEVSLRMVEPPDVPAELTPGPHVVLSVSDDGEGIEQGAQQRIFEPFFTTKERDRGTGLGLSTAWGFVRQSGGTIQVISAPGQGAAFHVLLPATDAVSVALSAGPAPAARTTGTEAILLVEDHEAVAEVSARVLRDKGYRVTVVTRSIDVVALLEDPAIPIDLLLTDVEMAGLDGIDLAERAAVLRPSLPVAFSTGYTSRSIERLRTAGRASRVLQKPYLPAQLLGYVRAVLDAETADTILPDAETTS